MRPNFTAALLAAVAVSACAAFASAADLNIGDKAPALSVGKWVQGEPVKEFENGKIYVVEFWATWCGPCKQTIPHLTELAKQYKDVVFIGQDVWERDREDTKVEPFVKEMGEQMTYRVATDDKSKDETGAMATTWMDAAGRDSIPTAFIVNKDGTIAWIGHPMEMDNVLKQVVAGTYDADAAKKEAAGREGAKGAAMEIRKALTEQVVPLVKAKDYAGADKALDGLTEKFPQMKTQLMGMRFGVLLNGHLYDQAYAVADQIAENSKDNAQQLNALAWTIVDKKGIEKRDLDRAEKYATRAVEVTDNKEPAILDTLARVHAEKGNLDKAIELQTKAVNLADDNLKAELQKTLDSYKSKATTQPA